MKHNAYTGKGLRELNVKDLLEKHYLKSSWHKNMADNYRSMHAHVIRVPEDIILFYSYRTLVAAYDIRTNTYWYGKHVYSATTQKQITAWSGICAADRRKDIANGHATEFDNFEQVSIY